MDFYSIYRTLEGTSHYVEIEGFEDIEESITYIEALIEEDKENGKVHDYEIDYKEKTVRRFHVSKQKGERK